MGELLLCKEPIGAMPYYIEGISLNVYSIEELCYYIANNVYLLDSDFMNEELCAWIERELHLLELSDELRNKIRENGKLSEFVEIILREICYLNPSQIVDVVTTLAQLEEKSEFECDKIRADRLMEKEKYLSSIYAYKHLLTSDDVSTADPIVVGNIYHNLGTAYARLFMFEDAAEYYKIAFHKNREYESLKELLFCYRCLHDEERFMSTALEYQLGDATIEEIKKELNAFSRCEEILEFEAELSGYADEINRGDRDRFSKDLDKMLSNWKDEYRRICRM